jgi:L-fuculose-phosphate aldolase
MTERRKAPASETELALRRAVVETAQAMSREGLSPGRSGNVSARCGAGALITPSGLPYETLTPEQIVLIRGDGSTAPGALLPSSEWQLHLAVYATHPSAEAIVHCHSPNATALACAGRPIPAFHYMVAVAGGVDIPLAPYATFGTRELADAVAATLEGRRACLLAHHGQIAFGRDLARALDLAREVEVLAMQYIKTLQIGGGPVLGEAAMAEVLAKFHTYGQQKQPAPRKPRRS